MTSTIKIVGLRLSFVEVCIVFTAGFFMSILNPLTILFWLGIYGSMLAKTAGVSTGFHIILNSIAILIGIILVDFIIDYLFFYVFI